jgi:hypothetical protein
VKDEPSYAATKLADRIQSKFDDLDMELMKLPQTDGVKTVRSEIKTKVNYLALWLKAGAA